eukprot:11882005-Prorocentrum_lima.AAC.1
MQSTGRQTSEFLVKNQFGRTVLASGQVETRVLLQEPDIMGKSTSALEIWQSSFKDWLRLRDLGHHGCAIEHYAFDRKGISALEKMARQWHSMKALETQPPADSLVSAEILRLTEFVVCTPCACHDAQNAFKW